MIGGLLIFRAAQWDGERPSWLLVPAASASASAPSAVNSVLFHSTREKTSLTRTDRAWFGEYASGADDYEAARRCFQSFLASETA